MSGYGVAASRTPPTFGGSWCGKSQFPQPSSGSTSASRVNRRRAQRPLDHGSNLIVVDGSRAARAGLVEQAITAIFQKPAAPLANGVFVDAEFGSHRFARQAVRTSQDRAAALR